MGTKSPEKFVNLHLHTSAGSIGDAIGSAAEHFAYAHKNGMDASAVTDHGNMVSYSFAHMAAKSMKDKGINFKHIPGIEAYFVPSLQKWSEHKKIADERNRLAKEADKEAKANKTRKKGDISPDPDLEIGDDTRESIKEMNELYGTPEKDSPESNTIIEDEEESKTKNFRDPVKQRNHIVLLAKNDAGLQSLFRLTSRGFTEGFYRYPRLDLKMLKEECKGNVVALSACCAGNLASIVFDNQITTDHSLWLPNDDNFELIQKLLKERIEEFKDAVGEENYYAEIQFNKLGFQHLANYHIIEAAKRTNTKLVATADAHYSDPSHWREREIYKAMAWASKNKGQIEKEKIPETIDGMKCELYPKNAEQMWNSYREYCSDKFSFYNDDVVRQAIENSWVIAHEQIGNPTPDRKVKLPAIGKLIPANFLEEEIEKIGSADDEDLIAFEDLKRLAKEGLIKRKKDTNKEYVARLVEELRVIKKLKFSRYFLTYAKVMNITTEVMLTGFGRGSAAGSLLAYCLNITQVDPIKYNLLFERFLTDKKIDSYPDIDSDFADRDKAVKLITKTFGEENVLPVSNFNQLQLRSLIKDVSRFYDIPFDEVNAYTAKFENEALAEAKKTPGFDRAGWVLTYDEAEQNSPSFREFMAKYPDLEVTVKVLFKQFRNISRHAGGVLITENGTKSMPVIKAGGDYQTPWPEGLNARHLEYFGFLKFDILGLGTLRMIEECIKRILKKDGMRYASFDDVYEWYYNNLHPDNNNMDDLNVYQSVYWKGRFAGVFQFVNPPVQRFIQQMKPKNIIDLAVATSIFRPGPLGLGVDKQYLKNRKKPANVQYDHPLIKEVLGPTSGLLVFQEQLMQMYNVLAGVPLAETDSVRKAFTKKDLSNKEKAIEARQKLRNEFIEKCQNVNGIGEDVSGGLFDNMEALVAYSFNKSHAVSYAMVSYMCAWLLTYYPNEWIASYIDYCSTEKGNVTGKDSAKSVALREAISLGYKVGKPDINLSEKGYQVIDSTLIPSFSSVKGIGAGAVKEIMDNRPYRSIQDLLFDRTGNWRHSKLNKTALSALIKLEALDSMNLIGQDSGQVANYRQLHHIVVDQGDVIKRGTQKKRKTHQEDLYDALVEAKKLSDWSTAEKVQFTKELLGSADLGLLVSDELRAFFNSEGMSCIDSREFADQVVWAVVRSASSATTKTGKPYLKLTLTGASGTDYKVFCWNYRPDKDQIFLENTVLIGRFKSSDFGLSCGYRDLHIVSTDAVTAPEEKEEETVPDLVIQ